MDDLQTSFTDSRYVIVENIFDSKISQTLYNSLIFLAKKYQKDFPVKVLNDKPWESDNFNNALITFRKNDKELFGAMYDSIQTSAVLNSAVCNLKTLSLASNILDCEFETLSVSGIMLRMDPPNDNRNRLEWHQESSYYSQNLKGENGLVLWSPLHTYTDEYGPLEVCIGSHKEGKVSMKPKLGNSKENLSDQYEVDSSYVYKYEKTKVLISAGDTICFNMDLFHRSGFNISNKFRFAIGVRFHKMLEEDFLPGMNIYHPNKTIGRLSDYNS